MVKLNINDAWKKILKEYDVLDKIYSKGFFNITAQQIKEFKEPRVMAKFDSSESLPSIFKKYNINILPTRRGSYILSDFELYKKLPELTERVTKMKKVEIPEFETIDKKI